MVDDAWLQWSYDGFPSLEEEFHAALAESLGPRDPTELLHGVVRDLGLPPGARAADVGCGEGRHALRLATELRLEVVGIDPVSRHVELARAAAAGGLRFELGRAESLPLADGSLDLVWCRDVLGHVAALDRAYAEFRRVLRPGGHALVYVMLGTDRLEPREAEELWRGAGVVPASADPRAHEAAIAAAGLEVEQRVDLGGEWAEWAEERSGTSSRRLLSVARLLRDPERYVERFGRPAYELMLADCLWHVYGLLGKLERRAYVLVRR